MQCAISSEHSDLLDFILQTLPIHMTTNRGEVQKPPSKIAVDCIVENAMLMKRYASR